MTQPDEAPARIVCPIRLDRKTGAELFDAARAAVGPAGVTLDFSGTESLDPMGAAWLVRIADCARAAGGRLAHEGETGHVAAFLEMIGPTLTTAPPAPPRGRRPFEATGERFLAVIREARSFLTLTVDAIYWSLLAPLEGRGFRVQAWIDEVDQMGVRAVPIVLLMNLLLGLIVAMLAAKQVEAFGIQILVAELISVAFARELAVVMTSVVVSARSGAAIAAELTSMRVQEEIDALRGMGLNITGWLVAPKLWAMVVVVPCLSALGFLAGLVGGSIWGVMVLDFAPSVWIDATVRSLDLMDLLQGGSKTFVFALAIVLIGCHNGFRPVSGSRGVGQMTTRAVVMDIFTLIVLDIGFAFVFYYL